MNRFINFIPTNSAHILAGQQGGQVGTYKVDQELRYRWLK